MKRVLSLCECGCGQQVNQSGNRFINGHNSRLWMGTDKNPMKNPLVSAKWRGENNPARRPEVRAKISKALRGRRFTEEWHRNLSIGAQRKIFTKEHKANISAALKRIRKGEQNPCWKGGISYEPYGQEFNGKLKEHVRARDDFVCRVCGVQQERLVKALHIHHIDYNKKNNNPENLISLCPSCHQRTVSRREYWRSYLPQLKVKQVTLG